MEEYNRYVMIADGDPAMKLARMMEIQSWFDNQRQLATTVMAKHQKQSEKVVIHPDGVPWEYIELLLSAMEQTDSPNPVVRWRWREHRSKMEHPEDQGSSIHTVSFVRVPWQSEPVESSSTVPNCKRRKVVGAMTLPRDSPRFPCRSSHLMGQRSAAEE
jgi:hypothetical protein